MRRGFKLDYKWVIVALSFLMVMLCLGFCSSPKSLFIVPVTEALGVKRSALSVNDSLRFITSAVVNVFFGLLISKFGAKKLILAGLISLMASQLVYSVADNVYVYAIGGILLGLGLCWTTTTMVGSIVNKWCKKNKGTIMGAVLAANGIGGAISIQIMTPIIESGKRGYVNAYRLVILVLAIVFILVALFFKNEPKNVEETDGEVAKKKRRGGDWVGIEFGNALKMPYFYAAVICIFLTGFVLQSVNGVAVAHMKDSGLDPAYVSMVWSMHSLALAGFKFLTGFIYDRFGLRTTMNICSFMAVLVMVSLVMVADTPAGRIFACIYAIFSSLALPLETIMLPIYAGDLFGQKSFDKVLGIFTSVNTAGYALGAPFINAFYDIKGSYNGGFIISGIVMIMVIIAMQFIVTKGHKLRKEAEQ